MKMVKSLLLGTAAGLVAMAGAQAADLPVKAKPVQYVKICSLYGAGFYYIPGTDMCLKIGGFVRAEYGWGMNGGFGAAPVNANVQNRTTNDSVMRARGYITADARNQSEFGTIRSYIAVGTSGSDVAGNPNFSAASGQTFDANRAFIQFAGFTFGITQSFYDFYNFAATGYIPDFYSDTGDSGWKAFAYTAQLGGGLSASISAEMRRNTQIIGVTSAGALAAAAATGAATPAIVGGASFGANNTVGGYGGFQSPDIVANLRVDQAWGSAQIMGALHEVNAAYYGGPGGVILEDSASVSTKWGFALGAGIKLNAPMIGAGDYFQTQVNYTEGALRYAYVAGPTNPYVQNGRSAAFGVLSDGVWGQGATAATNTSINLTTAWGFNAAYEHFWNKQWRTSIHGGYIAVRYNGQANALLCMLEAGQATGAGTTAVATPGCSNNWQAWAVGSRTQWNITPDTYLGLDVAYTRVETASSSFAGNQVPFPNSPATTSCSLGNGSPQLACLARDQGVWSARFRVHRDFYP